MPHTNRKKKSSSTQPAFRPKTVHTKRQQIEDNDGWTHVLETPRRLSRAKAQEPWLNGGDFTIDGVSYINRTLEEMKLDYEYYRKQWESNDACETLKAQLVPVEGNVGVRNVICLGLGSFQSSQREGRRASHTQLAALRTIINTLSSTQSLQCTLQDPQFTAVDKDFLVSFGYTVVDDPLVFDQVTENSLVYAIHCYAKIYESVSKCPRPALLIGTDIHNFGKFNLSGTMDSTARSLEEMIQGCKERDFPQLRHDFSDTKIYWRKITSSTDA